MQEKEIEYIVDIKVNCRKRHWHTHQGNIVLAFCVQLEVFCNNTWHPVVRYDTVHGFAHRDVLRYRGKSDKVSLPIDDFTKALQFAEADLRTNWQYYREGFLKEVEENDGKRIC